MRSEHSECRYPCARVVADATSQGLYDCSTIACEMLEIKCAMHANDPPPRKAKRIEAAVDTAVEACKDFISRLEPDGVLPSRVDEEQERAYIQAHFHLGRAYGKLDSPQSLSSSLEEYKLISDYLQRNQVEGMAQEAAVCKEMVRAPARRAWRSQEAPRPRALRGLRRACGVRLWRAAVACGCGGPPLTLAFSRALPVHFACSSLPLLVITGRAAAAQDCRDPARRSPE